MQVYQQQTLLSDLLAAQSSQLKILVKGQQALTDSSDSMQRPYPWTQLLYRGTSNEAFVSTYPMINVPWRTDKGTQSCYYQKRLRFFTWAAQISIARSFGKWQYTLETYSLAHIDDGVF